MSNPGPAITTAAPSQNVNTQQAIRLLAVVKGVNLNAVGDTLLPIINSTTYSVSNVVLANASISLTTAACSVYPAASAGGTAIVSNAVMSGMTGSTIVDQRTINSTAAQTGQNLYFHVGTAQGAAATCDVRIFGYDLS
jgi:hypothetical protein